MGNDISTDKDRFQRMNMRIFRMFGGMAIVTIALIVAGAGLPEYLPLAIVCMGFMITWMKR